VEERCDINEADAMGHTPLHVAAGSEEPGSEAVGDFEIYVDDRRAAS
jgi:hypothetical protein